MPDFVHCLTMYNPGMDPWKVDLRIDCTPDLAVNLIWERLHPTFLTLLSHPSFPPALLPASCSSTPNLLQIQWPPKPPSTLSPSLNTPITLHPPSAQPSDVRRPSNTTMQTTPASVRHVKPAAQLAEPPGNEKMLPSKPSCKIPLFYRQLSTRSTNDKACLLPRTGE